MAIKIKSKKTVNNENVESLNRSLSARIDSAKLTVFDKNCDMTDFNNACENFRSICLQIGSLFNIENFKGGYDEIEELKKNIVRHLVNYDIDKKFEIMMAFIELISADLNCNHEADKIGLYGASWWYKCWENAEQ